MGLDAKDHRPEPDEDEPRHALYDLADVRVALGLDPADLDASPPAFESDPDTGGLAASRERLRRIIEAGEEGRWRRLAHATDDALASVEAVGARAPHMREMTALVVRRLRAARATGTRIALPPTLLLGPPGVGKSWFMAHLAGILGVPFRLYPMNLSTLTDELSGSHPCWRSSAPGLVARSLIQEGVANPLILIDELDKPPRDRDGDPYRPLYACLEPECARAFRDEHLQMPIDASAVMWVMSANDMAPLPAPIVDRLTVIEVPEMSRGDRMTVVASIYAEANERFRGFFDPSPDAAVLSRLAAGNARRARLAVEDAMVRAAAAGRRTIGTGDVAGAAARSLCLFDQATAVATPTAEHLCATIGDAKTPKPDRSQPTRQVVSVVCSWQQRGRRP